MIGWSLTPCPAIRVGESHTFTPNNWNEGHHIFGEKKIIIQFSPTFSSKPLTPTPKEELSLNPLL